MRQEQHIGCPQIVHNQLLWDKSDKCDIRPPIRPSTPTFNFLRAPTNDEEVMILHPCAQIEDSIDSAAGVEAPNVHRYPACLVIESDCRTRGESPLHRAAAFGTADTIDLLLGAGADREARDAHGDTPLGWAGWYARPDDVLRRLCYGPFRIREDRQPLRMSLLGSPRGQH